MSSTSGRTIMHDRSPTRSRIGAARQEVRLADLPEKLLIEENARSVSRHTASTAQEAKKAGGEFSARS
jgi:hypothetical protein